jgi:hypothetical protein
MYKNLQIGDGYECHSLCQSVGVAVPGPVKDPNCRGEETVQVAGGFDPDRPQTPARGESFK